MTTDYTELNASKRAGSSRAANGAAGPSAGGPRPVNAVLDDAELGANLAAINPAFGELCVRVAGEVWGRPLIDQKTKALIVIAIDVVNQSLTGPGVPFGAHVGMAMKQGATRAEIEEVLLLTCVYAGFNKAAGAFGALSELLGPA
jgi:4-carboxymuconolactone decarboxylase